MPIRRLILAALLSPLLAACAQEVRQGSPAASGSPSQTTASSATLQATPEFPAPAELQGTWGAVSDSGSDLVLVLRETGYTLTQSSTATGSRSTNGRIEVEGAEIHFSNANACPGDGRYRWSIENDVLRFEAIGEDECTGRTGSFVDTEYTATE